MVIAQISDLHIGTAGQLAYGRIDTAANLARCVASILRLGPRPDVVVASGDLVDTGAAEEYRRLRELLAPLPMPVYLMPGNHDDRAALRAEFRDHSYLPAAGALHFAVGGHAIRLIMLDTVVADMDGGALGAPQLDWLAATLAADPEMPALIFMHHPPIMTGIRCMDEIALAADDVARLDAVVSRHPQVERIACGHVHRTVESRWCGTMVGICPSTAFQANLGLRTESFEVAADEPPAYQVHYWNGANLITHTLQVVD
ncbi:MAG: phosphodiesterase [Betaproteobacteria bacterium]|nr:phosphodiesterase [Betaproteobacteria bacterium]